MLQAAQKRGMNHCFLNCSFYVIAILYLQLSLTKLVYRQAITLSIHSTGSNNPFKISNKIDGFYSRVKPILPFLMTRKSFKTFEIFYFKLKTQKNLVLLLTKFIGLNSFTMLIHVCLIAKCQIFCINYIFCCKKKVFNPPLVGIKTIRNRTIG